MTNRCFLRCPVWDQSTHHFPNHKKHHDRFKAWVEAIDRKLETDDDYEYFRTKRLCHIHFIPIYCYNNRRLSPFAVPTLYLTKESRDEYWSKELELRKSMQHSKSPNDEAETQKHAVETNYEEPVMIVEDILSNNIQSLLQSDAKESLVNILIADILEGENENYADVQLQPTKELSVPRPVESYVPKPVGVADIIIEYVSTTDEGYVQKLSMKQIARDITISEEVESLPLEPVSIQDISVDSTLLETSAEEIEINFDSGQNCIQQPKKKRKSKYDEFSWELPLRIPMEHNYSKASIVAPTSHISSNGVHPKKTIITLKSKVKELRKKLKFYKQKCKDLLHLNQETVIKQIKNKKITKTSQKGQQTHKKAYKNVISYSNLKNAGCSISLPRNI